LFVFFFFFQAEDGIRDLTVTGVQTCALPIFMRSRAAMACSPSSFNGFTNRQCFKHQRRYSVSSEEFPKGDGFRALSSGLATSPRSEERRVGKEGRSRWGAYQ